MVSFEKTLSERYFNFVKESLNNGEYQVGDIEIIGCFINLRLFRKKPEIDKPSIINITLEKQISPPIPNIQ